MQVVPFLLLKVIHVFAAIVAVGANVTYAFWLRRAGRDRERLVWTLESVRRLDRAIANPAYILLLITGVLMVLTGAYSFEQRWITLSIVLYAIVALIGITVYGPALRRQIAEAERDPTSPEYARAERRSTTLGIFTTAIAGLIVVLMVTKPPLTF
jgi:uncharacterized membrane protein